MRKDILGSITGNELDFTKGSLKRAILVLSVPMVLEMLMEIPLAYLLAVVLGFEQNGVYVAIVASESMMSLAAFVLFRRGKWKLKQL